MFTYNPSSFYNRFIGNNNNTKSIRLINSIDENIKKLEKLETLEIIRTSCHTNKPIYLDNLKYLNKLHTLTLTNCCDTFIKSIMPNTKLDNIKTLVINSYDTCCCPKCNNFIFNTNCLNILKYLPLLETLIIKESFHIWKTINNFNILSELNNKIYIQICRLQYNSVTQITSSQRDNAHEQEIYNYIKK
jgi:hypothetical protein